MAPATVKCPTCGKRIAWVDTEKFKPFCSERCKLIDLGEWASGGYAVPGEDLNDLEPDRRDRPDE